MYLSMFSSLTASPSCQLVWYTHCPLWSQSAHDHSSRMLGILLFAHNMPSAAACFASWSCMSICQFVYAVWCLLWPQWPHNCVTAVVPKPVTTMVRFACTAFVAAEEHNNFVPRLSEVSPFMIRIGTCLATCCWVGIVIVGGRSDIHVAKFAGGRPVQGRQNQHAEERHQGATVVWGDGFCGPWALARRQGRVANICPGQLLTSDDKLALAGWV